MFQKNSIFKNVDLTLNRGEALLLSGNHGVGKSTLLSTIAGIHSLTEGEILVDGENINSYRAEQIPNHVGWLRTQNLIFRGTIRDNITCFGQTSETQAKEIATLLDVDTDIAKLPGGFNTFLNGNNTDNIPIGLKQRIAMVRVLATKPRIILFDNADKSLDKKGYGMVYSLLARLKNKVSMVIISEDQNIRALATQSYVLEKATLNPTKTTISKSNIHPYKELRL